MWDTPEDITYTVSPVDFFKVEPDVDYAQVLSAVSAGNGAACGVRLEIGEEYLIGLTSDLDHDDQFSVGSCSLVRTWSSITDEDMSFLENGCSGDS